ncbi:MAG: SPOR domain-containing protein [Ignavibacterium sp.]|nr:SPOR domain-containing protein [Ignavibacterium sp.]
MTRAELIRKISKQAGVPDSESRIFFEIFLRKLTAILRIGQAINIKGFGYFYLLQGKIIKSADNVDSENYRPEFIDLIYFSGSKVEDLKKNEGLFFNIPNTDEDEFNSVDASFSLSFGKPLIPFKGYTESDFYIPHTGSELRRLIESKVDKNIENAEITNTVDLLQAAIEIDSDIFTKPLTAKEDEFIAEPEDNLSITKISDEDFTKLEWDLDKDLIRQIEEESIIDMADSSNEEESVISWDFSSFEDLNPESIQPKEFSKTDEAEKQNKERIQKDEKIADENETSKDSVTEKPAASDKFERVKSLTKISDIDLDKKSVSFTSSTQEKEESFKKKVLGESFPAKKDRTEFVDLKDKFKSKVELEEQEPMDQLVKKPFRNDVKEKSSIYTGKEKLRQKRIKSRTSYTPYFMLAFSLMVIGYGIYYYLNNIKGVSEVPVEKSVKEFNTDKMVVIDREFDFPVTYPYSPKPEGTINESNILDLKDPEQVKVEEITEVIPDDKPIIKDEEKPVQPELKVNNQPPSGSVKTISVNLFQYGNVYIIQVAAFRSNSVAENEAGRFRNKGYNAFVERAEIDGSIWHRVRVGNFTDLEEAKKFAVQFK